MTTSLIPKIGAVGSLAQYSVDSSGNVTGLVGPDGNYSLVLDPGLTPDDDAAATASSNSTKLLAAIAKIAAAGGGVMQVATPGTYWFNHATTPLLPDNIRWVSGPGVRYINAVNCTTANFARNANWNATLFGVTSATASYAYGGSGTGAVDVVLATDATGFTVGEYAVVKGDPYGTYNGIWRVTAVSAGVSVTVRISIQNGVIPRTITAGSTSLGIAGFKLNASPDLAGLTRTALADSAFVAPITGTGGSGAIAQVDAVDNALTRLLVSEPGYGYTSFSGATIDLSAGYSGAGVATWDLSKIATPYMMTIAKANANITIEGGVWDWNSDNTGIFNNTADPSQRGGFMFNRVANTVIRDLEFEHIDLFNIVANSQNTLVENVVSRGGQVVALAGPCNGALVRNVRSMTHDDALTTSVCTGVDPASSTNDYSYLDLPDQNGPVQDVTYDDNRPGNSIGRCMISVGRGWVTRGIKIRNNQGTPLKPHFGRDIVTWAPNRKVVSADGGGYLAAAIYTVTDPRQNGVMVGMRVNGLYAANDCTITGIAASTGQPATDGYAYTMTVSAANTSSTTGVATYLFEGIADTSRNNAGIVISGLAGGGYGLLDDIEIDGVTGDPVGSATLISVTTANGGTCTPVVIDRLKISGISNNGYRLAGSYISVGSGQTVRNMDVQDCLFKYHTTSHTGGDTNRFGINIEGTVDSLRIHNSTIRGIGMAAAVAGLLRVNTSAVVQRAEINGAIGLMDGPTTGAVLLVGHYSTTATKYRLDGVTLKDGSCFIAANASCDVTSTGARAEGSAAAGLFNFYGTSKTHNVAIQNLMNYTAANAMAYGTTNTLNLIAGDGTVKLDGTKLTAVFTGALFYNTNAAYGAGVGLYAMGAAATTRIAA